jgi:tRNA G26 N,N-dimethylase Trm1
MEKFEFIRLLLSHIPEKNFKIVRYVGIYSRRGYKHKQTEFHEAEVIQIKKSWREEIMKTFKYDPLICPYCETEMELIGTCYEGTDSYPTEEPKPVEPPSDCQHSQQDRIRFILSVIKNNQNGRGASIEKVISEAAKIGMNREHAISYIEHLKQNGYAYEPINGEIKCAF